MSKSKSVKKRVIAKLREIVIPTGKPGKRICEFTRSHSHKDRKRKGHREARLILPQMKWKEVRELGIDPQKYWDDWRDHRDGGRHNTLPDQLYHKWKGCCKTKEEIITHNKRILKLIQRRKAKRKIYIY